ncbi:MAG: fibronectin, partial [candidate division KSB1 bacterium]|nr:fibronectin [candidate division KSB1 bacterium]
PPFCTIKIFTERGDLIYTIEHTDGSGDAEWNSITSSRQVVVSGVYIAHFEVTEDYYDSQTGELLFKKGDSAIRKFVIIR